MAKKITAYVIKITDQLNLGKPDLIRLLLNTVLKVSLEVRDRKVREWLLITTIKANSHSVNCGLYDHIAKNREQSLAST